MNPDISIIIPTYNRSDLLTMTLEKLACQTLATERFEVIVSDDGSTDDTAASAASFQSRLQLQYTFQGDLGYRAAAARNAGARLAHAPILAFLDTGVIPGPGYASGHLCANGRRRVVLGYTYGSEPKQPLPGLAHALREMNPSDVRVRYDANSSFRDGRHDRFSRVEYDLDRHASPWLVLWSLNFSLSADDFWSVGGFDEDFVGWGMEDLDLGYRLHRRGASFFVSRDAWGIEYPHERDPERNTTSNTHNVLRFLLKHPEPVLELTWAWFLDGFAWSLEDEYDALRDWTAEAAGLDVEREIHAALRVAPLGADIAIFGCGPRLPALMPTCAAFDFDHVHARAASAYPHHPVGHAIGIRTTLADNSVDLVVLTSRLQRLWSRHGNRILAEANRIGRHVWAATELDGESAG